jgi:hypothetical protein
MALGPAPGPGQGQQVFDRVYRRYSQASLRSRLLSESQSVSQLTLTMLSQSLLRSLESQLGESSLLSLFLFQLCLRRPGAPGQFPGRREGHCGLQLTKSSLFVRPAPSSLALTSRGVGTNDEGSRRRARRGPSVFLKEWPLAGKTGKIKGSRRTRLSPGAL